MSNNVYLASKPRYEILDGLRGVAAMMVVFFHIFEGYAKSPAQQIINHGYLAVDFFFLLSGFVIGYAYDDRWDRMSIGGRIVPKTAESIPAKPAVFQPTWIAAFTAIGPGAD